MIGQALVLREVPRDADDDRREHQVLADQERQGLDLHPFELGAPPAPEARHEHRQRPDDAEKERHPVDLRPFGQRRRQSADVGDVGQEAGGDTLKALGEGAHELSQQEIAGQSAEDQHAAERHDEGRHFGVGDKVALRGADQRAHGEADQDHEREGHLQVDDQRSADRAHEADDRSDREVDVTGDDDQQHSQRHDDDVGVLHDQVGDIDRRNGRMICGYEIEERDDQQQRAEQPVVAQIVFPQLAAYFGLERGGVRLNLRGHWNAPAYWRMIDAMIFS